MPTIRLTKTAVERLEYQGKQANYFDDRMAGWGVRVNAGSKTYFVQCRVKGRTNERGQPLEIKVSIGRTDHIKFERAYERAKDILEDAAHGITPDDRQKERDAAEQRAKILATAEEKKDITLQEVLDKYCETKKKLKQSSKDLYQEDFDRYTPDWLPLPLRSIDSDMIVAKHAEIGAKSPARADSVMRVVRALFNFAMAMYEDVIVKNPVKKLSILGAWYLVGRKETYLEPSQIRVWFDALLKLRYDTSRDYILLLLFNGPRMEIEAASLKWKDINFAERTVKFRETKNGDPLWVPMSEYIVKVMVTRKKFYHKGPESYVFPSYGKTGHITGARDALESVAKHCGIKVTHHDLRRSFLSYCEALDVPIFTQKRLVGHALPSDVTEGYIQFPMEKLRYEIERIAEFILSNAGIAYRKTGSLLTGNQIESLQGTEFWNSLSKEQRDKFTAAMQPVESNNGDRKVVDLDAIRTQKLLGGRG